MNQVAKIRKYMELTQTDVSKMLGISLQAYYRKENGKTPFSDVEKVKLKAIFSEEFPDVTIDYLFFNPKVSKVES